MTIRRLRRGAQLLMGAIARFHRRSRPKAALLDRQALIDDRDRKVRQALRVSRSFTFDWNPRTDRVERSDSIAPMLGLTGDEAVISTGQRYLQRIHPDDHDRFVQMLHSLTPAAADYATEYRVLRPDGDEMVLEEIGQAEFDADGSLTRLFGVATNITERKRAEETTWETAAKLTTANATLDAAHLATLNLVSDAVKAKKQRCWHDSPARTRIRYCAFPLTAR